MFLPDTQIVVNQQASLDNASTFLNKKKIKSN
jgi:hypothetical protein